MLFRCKNGFIQRLEQTGFKVKQVGTTYFCEEKFAIYGIHLRSVLYIVSK